MIPRGENRERSIGGSLHLRLDETPVDHPRHTLMRRQFKLYERLWAEGIRLRAPILLNSEHLLLEEEMDLFVELEMRRAFNVIPDFLRERAADGQWDSHKKWDELRWEGYVWCPGPSRNGVGRSRGWYTD